MTPLAFAQHDKLFVIKEIKGRDKDKSRLTEQGFCIGNKISLLKDDARNYIVKINETKYVLSFGLANKILLEECK
ncbi:FeoA family protein [uncultured Cetobacterium sp.]|uniref:FeoA family protein n=1 Tax=uncultured Cetobacterium sp. TaxID=527638 RepID=UPI0026230E14|nr:FeoA family protein [uncultured Cetobacterium sp.]